MTARDFLLRYRRLFVVWCVVGTVAMLGVMFYYTPWTSRLGVANSPQRQMCRVVVEWWIFKLPFALLAMSLVAGKPKWLAPRGRYQEGVEYPIFTTYTYVAIALCAALFSAAGILSFEFLDLASAPAALAVSFFNPIIGFFTLWLGGVARSLIFGTGNPVLWALGVGPIDGVTWIYLGIFYWWFREDTTWGKSPVARMVFWVGVYWIWRTIWMFDGQVWRYPIPALWGRMAWFFTQFLPSGTLGSLAGLVAAEALCRAVERGPHAKLPSADAASTS